MATGVAASFNIVSSMHVNPALRVLPQSFDPTLGGLPFCFSGSLGNILCYTGSFLRTAYNIPSNLDGTGSNIVIVDAFGSPTAQSDLNHYDTVIGLPATTVTILCGPTWTGSSSDTCPVFDPTLPIDQACGAVGWWEETTLDLQMSHSIAPGAHITLVVANDCQDTSFNAAEGAIVNNPAYHGAIMSQSFGEPDDLVGCSTFPCPPQTVDHSIRQTADGIYNLARRNGWTVIASSGDDGANEALSAVGTIELTPSWPATNPLNLAAGGTQGNPYGGQYGAPTGPGENVTCAANTNCNTGLVIINGGATGCNTALRPGVPTSCTPVGYGGEATWNEFNVFGVRTASGGGVSPHYGLPRYQMGLLPKTVPTVLGATVPTNGRLTPDVSFNSAIDGGFLAFAGFIGAHGRYVVFGGTSAASPAWAGIVALANQSHGGSLGFITTAIYQLAESSSYSTTFHDITAGENSDTAGQFGVDGFSAGTGYDLATGWGTPNVANFIAGLNTICSHQCPGP